LTFACDFLKGLLPVLILPLIVGRYCWEVDVAIPRLVCAGCAIAGHNWTVFLKFRGGKGVATSTGALLGVAWLAVAAGVAVWVVVFSASRYVSLASLAAAAATVIVGWVWLREPTVVLPVALTVLGIVTALRHTANIRRLLNGTEHRAGSAGRGVSPRKV
jgi:glycerol-3-phosphate acyltransferase PlsY